MEQELKTPAASTDVSTADAAEHARKTKRQVIVALLIMAVFAVVAIPVISLIDHAVQDDQPSGKPSQSVSVIWAEADYERKTNIRTDPSYLALNRNISLKQDNRTFAIVESDLKNQSPAVEVLYQLINAIIDGDADIYNSLFSTRYYTENGGKSEDPFTMQRVYDVLIEEIRERTVTTEADGEYTEYIYSVEYKINRNDGTYRTDIGHDASRPQYFMLTDREGDVRIDRLMYMDG